MLGFWAGIPWALKMPLGHVVDLAWRWKSLLVFLGAALIAASLGIMLGLLSAPSSMARYMSVEAWFVLSALLAARLCDPGRRGRCHDGGGCPSG